MGVGKAEKLEKLEETQSNGDGENSTEISSNVGNLLPQEWTVEEVADWLWNLEGDKHRRLGLGREEVSSLILPRILW